MLWNVFVFHPSNQETTIHHLEVKEARSMSDVRLVYSVAEKELKFHERYMLAVPHKCDIIYGTNKNCSCRKKNN
jgi:hypothetical protein